MSVKIKYPDQIRALKRKGKNISVRFILSPYTERLEEEGKPPLEFPGYSRYVMSILKTEGGLTSVTANIPQEELPAIALRTEIAVKKIIDYECGDNHMNTVATPSVEDNDTGENKVPSIAHEVKFGFPADIKGKTLFQVIQCGMWEKALGQKQILESNLTRFPTNKKTIDAIDKIAMMFRNGELTMDDFTGGKGNAVSVPNTTAKSITIYSTDFKYFSKQRQSDGKNQIYQIKIECVPSNKYPFYVSIVNAYGNVVTTQTGGKNIVNVTDRVALDMYLTESEWVNLIKRMEQLDNIFEQNHGEERFRVMAKHSYKPENEQKNPSYPSSGQEVKNYTYTTADNGAGNKNPYEANTSNSYGSSNPYGNVTSGYNNRG